MTHLKNILTAACAICFALTAKASEPSAGLKDQSGTGEKGPKQTVVTGGNLEFGEDPAGGSSKAGGEQKNEYELLAEYKAGDSLAPYFKILSDSRKKAKIKPTEKKLLEILGSKEVSDESFALICSILKTISSDDSVPALKKFLNSDFRAPHVCDVLITLEGEESDEALRDFLKSSPSIYPAISAISTLAARGDRNVGALAEAAENPDRLVALAAVKALGRIGGEDALEALEKICSKDDFRKAAALDSILSVADSAALSGNRQLAWDALELLPDSDSRAVSARARLKKPEGRSQYLDRVIIGGGKPAMSAARIMGCGREYDSSSEILAAFPSLPDEQKTAAIGTFIQAPDVRYWEIVRPCMDSPNPKLRAEAVYSARFLCRNDEDLRKIFSVLKSESDPCRRLAEAVFLENPFPECAKILNENANSGDLESLKILVFRGDTDARNKLWTMYFSDGGTRDSKVSSLFEKCVSYADLPELAERIAAAKAQDSNGSAKYSEKEKSLAKIIIKKLASSRDADFVNIALPAILDGKLEASDPMRKFIEEKLQKLRSSK